MTPHTMVIILYIIKKESPNEGTETFFCVKNFVRNVIIIIKKESPNEGTETRTYLPRY